MPNPHPRNTLRRHQGKPRVFEEERNILGQEGPQGTTHSCFCLHGILLGTTERGDALEKCSSITLFGDRGEKSEVGNRVWSRSSGEEAPTPANTAQSLPCSQQPQGALQANPCKAKSRNLLTPQTQEGGSVLPTPCWQKGKKKLNGSCRMPHAGCCRGCRETRSGDVELLPWLHSPWLLLYLNQVFPSLETQAWGFQSTITCMSCRMAGNLFPWLCFWTCGLRQLSEKSALPLPTAGNSFPKVTDASCMQQKAPGMAMQTTAAAPSLSSTKGR